MAGLQLSQKRNCIKPYPWWLIFHLFIVFLTGKVDRMQYIEIIQTNKAKIRFMHAEDIQIDGEIMNGIKDLEVRCLQGVLKVIYP